MGQTYSSCKMSFQLKPAVHFFTYSRINSVHSLGAFSFQSEVLESEKAMLTYHLYFMMCAFLNRLKKYEK